MSAEDAVYNRNTVTDRALLPAEAAVAPESKSSIEILLAGESENFVPSSIAQEDVDEHGSNDSIQEI